ncbi:UBAP1-MVB12-associated (UMA)-domain containing protein 1 isoform X1 [Festucalex cinctus]
MFSFLGLRKDSKKSPSESREADGGFVIIGETVEEQRRKIQLMNIEQPSTNVIVLPSKAECPAPARPVETVLSTDPSPTHLGDRSSVVESSSSAPDVLGDIPFALAPHVQEMQQGFSSVTHMLLSKDMNSNLMYFQYDFTLEKSILHFTVPN